MNNKIQKELDRLLELDKQRTPTGSQARCGSRLKKGDLGELTKELLSIKSDKELISSLNELPGEILRALGTASVELNYRVYNIATADKMTHDLARHTLEQKSLGKK